jgi:hypothetical protein
MLPIVFAVPVRPEVPKPPPIMSAPVPESKVFADF